MANKFFNPKFPEFITKFGKDWTSFRTLFDSWVDDIVDKIFRIRHEKSINNGSLKSIERQMRSKGITIDATDTLLDKKIKLRQFVKKHQKKGMEETYLDPIQEIVGIRGVIYSGRDVRTWKWNFSRWRRTDAVESNTDIIWSISVPRFVIYIDVKTTDSGLLDEIQQLLEGELRPAYYTIKLIDSNFNVLRTIA